ncbi:MAG: hypothetical protein A2428_16475 [Bdellovibrionales bacterium RIFOXYC1_FULL_54_43]|nr:MAG: hypothetical protein A2428_16475 [Bdellovibrionales bacterium RIFOXYC1_FULL_54_43]OFZ83938.1 MAG: hypothetical protein A2603_10320 [Bdellovibrionales bacterium RIFOXYD1_FULL_55_31]
MFVPGILTEGYSAGYYANFRSELLPLVPEKGLGRWLEAAIPKLPDVSFDSVSPQSRTAAIKLPEG